MKKPVVDYRKFRLSKLNQPEFSHIHYLWGWVFYLLFYFLTENFIPVEKCHVIHCWLDDLVVFNELFLIPYTFWYLFLVGSLLYFFLYDIERFKQLQTYLIITQVIAMTVYIVYPSVQTMRPVTFERDNFLTHLMALIYTADTPTGVCPSLHVAYSLGIASVWTKYKPAPTAWKVFTVIAAVVISISTAFVKQHSVVDIFAALPVCLIAEGLVYGKMYAGKLSARRQV